MTSIWRTTTIKKQLALIAAPLLLLVGTAIVTQAAVQRIDTFQAPVASVRPADTANVSVRPSAQAVAIGETFTVTVEAAGLTQGLSGFQFDLAYDPAVIDFVAADDTPFLGSTGRQVICPATVKQTGRVRLACVSTGPTAGPTNSGDLIELSFYALADGASTLALEEVQLTDSARPPATMSVELHDGSVVVGDGIPLTGVTIHGPDLGTTDTPVAFSATISPTSATPPISYTWSPEPDAGQGTANVTYIWGTTGTYTIQVGAENGGGGGAGIVSDTHTITIGIVDVPLTGVTIHGPELGITDTPVAFGAAISPTSVTPPISYTWSPEPDAGQETANVTYTWGTTGTYVIQVDAENSGGVVSDTHTIVVESERHRIYLPLVVKQPSSEAEHTQPTASLPFGLSLAGLGLSALAYLAVDSKFYKRIPWQRVVSGIVLVSVLAGSVASTPVRAMGTTEHGYSSTRAADWSKAPLEQTEGCFWADPDCDQDVDVQDLRLDAEHWNCASGEGCYDAVYDRDSDGDIDVVDLAALGNEYDVEPPQLTITAPANQTTLGGSFVQVTGIVSDVHTVEVTVNDVTATVNAGTFEATMPLKSGNQVLIAAAIDQVGMGATASSIVSVDQEGPMVGIHAPKRDQAIYTLQPTVAISYTDFYTDVNVSSLSVTIVKAGETPIDVTGDLTVMEDEAWGTLSTPLTEDTVYTLTVSIADILGNTTQSESSFYVPVDPASITPPVVPEQAGWVSGRVYDTSNCDEYLQECEGLVGAHVTLVHAGSLTDTIMGTAITGPDGFFAFPLPETDTYWLRVEKQGYTYGQREVEVIRERSTATNDIYLTPLDTAVTVVSYPLSGTITHVNNDGRMEVEIPPKALAPGQVVTVTATVFEHVEFLPSGELPPGTAETYAFNLGGDSEVTFTRPITVRIQNYLGFAPGTLIPLGYWNQDTFRWEHAGTGVVDASGDWVEMAITHFSNYDCNSPWGRPVPPPPPPMGEPGTPGANPGCAGGGGTGRRCQVEEDGCAIGLKSGLLREEYALPATDVLGKKVAPKLSYDTRRANPGEVIDINLTLDYDQSVELGDYVIFELYIEGQKTQRYTISSDLVMGEVGRYRYFWDGRDVQGNLMPPGVYQYAAKLSVPYRSQYCYSLNGIFGNPPDCENGATGVFIEGADEVWLYDTIELNSQPDSVLGAGWELQGLQRLDENEVGQILVSSDGLNEEFYRPNVGTTALEEEMVIWTDDFDSLKTLSEGPIQNWRGDIIEMEGDDLALSPDGRYLYASNSSWDRIHKWDLVDETLEDIPLTTSGYGSMWRLKLSADGNTAYVVQDASDSVTVVNLDTLSETIIAVGDGPSDIALSQDETRAYVVNRYDNTVSVIDLETNSVITSAVVGDYPVGIALSLDESVAYVASEFDDYISVLDLTTLTITNTIEMPDGQRDIVLSPDGSRAYVADGGLSVVNLATEEVVRVSPFDGDVKTVTVSPDGTLIYTVSYDGMLQIVGAGSLQQIDYIPARIENLMLSPDGQMGYGLSADMFMEVNVSVIDLAARREYIHTETLETESSKILLNGEFAHILGGDQWDGFFISTFNLASEEVEWTFKLEKEPGDIALSQDGGLIYITNPEDNTLSVLNLTTHEEYVIVELTDSPGAITVLGNVAYVGIGDLKQLAMVDLIEQTVLTTTLSGSVHKLVPAPDGLSIYGLATYMTCPSCKGLLEIDAASGREIDTLVLSGGTSDYITDIVFSPDGNLAYIAYYYPGGIETFPYSQIMVVNLDTWTEEDAVYESDYNLVRMIAMGNNRVYTGDGMLRGRILVFSYPSFEQIAVINAAPQALVATNDFAFKAYSRTEIDHSWLEYDVNTATYTRHYPNQTRVHFNPDGTHDYTVDPQGNKTLYTYNTADGTVATMVISMTGESAPHWAWNFDYVDGKLTAITDPAERTTTFTIDEHDHLTAIAGPDGSTRRYTYDARGLLTHYTDENGDVTEHVYDAYGRVTHIIEPPRPIYDPLTGQTVVTQEVRSLMPSDTGYPLLTDGPAGDPGDPAPPVPTSADLEDRVEYGRGGYSGHTDKWGRWLDKTDALGRTTTYQRDGAGNLLRRDNPDGTCAEYDYDVDGKLLQENHMGAAQCALAPEDRDPAQVQTSRYTYEERFNQLKTHTDPLNNTTTYIYDYEVGLGEAGNLVRVEYPPVPDEYGTLVTPTVTYGYNQWGQAVTETDKLGVVTVYRYTQGTPDEAHGQPNALFAQGVTPVPGLLTQVTRDYGGLEETTTYRDFDAAGKPQTVLGPGYAGGGGGGCSTCGGNSGSSAGGAFAGGTETHYTYDAWDRVLTEKNALGIVTKYEYDGKGQLVRLTRDYTADGTTGENVVTEYVHDPHGNPLSERTEADGIVHQTTNAYDVNRKLTATTDAGGNTANYTYNDADQLVALTDPLGHTTVFTYTADGKQDSVQYPGGRVAKYTYDDQGRVMQEIDDYGGLNLTTTYTYSLDNRLAATADPAGTVTCYTHDGVGRRITETHDCGGLDLTTTYTYTIDGRPVRTTDPRGVTAVSVYDPLGRLVLTRQDDGGLNLETHYGYDEAGNLTVVTDTRGTATRYEHDALGRQTAVHADADGLDLVTRFGYDRLGRQNVVTDSNGIVSFAEYNAFGQPVRSVADYGGLNVTTRYAYDDNLNVIAITDDSGNTTHYTYDALNRQMQTLYADGTSITTTYNPDGTVASRTNQASEMVTSHYDDGGRLVGRTLPGGTQSFSYDGAGRMSSAWQTMLGHTTGISFTYDSLGAVAGHTQTVDGYSWATTYDYDYAAGEVTTIYPSGTQVVKTLDPLGRLYQVQQDGAPVAGYTYDDATGMQTLTHANGVVSHVETDPLGRVTRLHTESFADYRYGYDDVGSRTYMQRAHQAGAPADVYAYDSQYQLTQVWYGADATDPAAITTYDHLQVYDLDTVGNRLAVQDGGASVAYLPNDGQKLTNPMHRYEQVDGQTLTYDLKGNLTDGGTNTYTYDVLNRQTGMAGPGGTAEYIYDAFGRRAAKVVDGTTTYYVYNDAYQVIEERNGSDQLLARYTYGGYVDEVLTMEHSGNTYTYHRDALGSVTEVTDGSGGLLERYEYDVYGAAQIFDGSGSPLVASAIGNPYLFTGRRYDPESGNYYYRARVYSPRLGRFLQMDSLGYVDGMNLYEYVFSIPVSFTDPIGLKAYPTPSQISGQYTGQWPIHYEARDTVKDWVGMPIVGPALAGLYANLQYDAMVKYDCRKPPGSRIWKEDTPGWHGLGYQDPFTIPMISVEAGLDFYEVFNSNESYQQCPGGKDGCILEFDLEIRIRGNLLGNTGLQRTVKWFDGTHSCPCEEPSTPTPTQCDPLPPCPKYIDKVAYGSKHNPDRIIIITYDTCVRIINGAGEVVSNDCPVNCQPR
jgi:RHS repeat-associated protein